MGKDLTILFLSCDKYRDLWEPLLYCFRKYWKDCPYAVRLGSNTVSTRKIQTILSGPDKDWSSSLQTILKHIDTPYVFLWLDDIFPVSRVNTQDFRAALDFMKKSKAKHIHAMPAPRPDTLTADGRFGIYDKGAPYRATSVGFWDISYLKKLLIPGESPWNFEIMGSYRTKFSNGFYCCMKPLFERIHVVEKGQIFQDAYEYCQTHRIPLSVTKRSILTNTFYLKSELQKAYFNAVIKVPWKIRVFLMDILRRLTISY